MRFRKIQLPKLNQKGIAQHTLVAVMVISAFAGIAAYRIFQSSAASQFSLTVSETYQACQLAGRKWQQSKCVAECRLSFSGNVYREYDSKTGRPAHCSNHVATNTDESTCVNTYHRYYLNKLGCARMPDQQNDKDQTFYCQPNYPVYDKSGSNHTCKAKTTTPAPTPAQPATCVAPKSARDNRGNCYNPTSAQDCGNKGRAYSTANDHCTTTCLNTAHVYNATTQTCGPKGATGPTCSPPLEAQGSYCVDKAKQAACGNQGRAYSTARNECTQTCLDANKAYNPANQTCVTKDNPVSNCVAPKTAQDNKGNCYNPKSAQDCGNKGRAYSTVRDECVTTCLQADHEYKSNTQKCEKKQAGSSSGTKQEPKNDTKQTIKTTDDCKGAKGIYKGKCVTKAELEKCLAKGLEFNAEKDNCTNNCQNDKHIKVGGKCEAKAKCPGSQVTYDQASNSCKCRNGAQKIGDNNCLDPAVKKKCDEQRQQYDSEKNSCKESCIAGWYKKDGKLPCLQMKSNVGGDGCPEGKVRNLDNLVCITPNTCKTLKAKCGELPELKTTEECAKQFLAYNDRLKRCGTTCLEGYILKKAECVPKSSLTAIELCELGGQNVSTCVRAECDLQHLEFDADTITCLDECELGYDFNDEGVCEEVFFDCDDEATCEIDCGDKDTCGFPCMDEDGIPYCEDDYYIDEDLAGSCAVSFLEYDPETQSCKEECTADFVMQDGECVDVAVVDQETMSERLCETLGRDWTESDDPDTAASCNSNPTSACLDGDAVYVQGASDVTSYCTGGDIMVSIGQTTQQECESNHYVYLSTIDGCSWSCEGIYYNSGEGCVEMWDNDFYDGGNGDGYSSDGGCLYGDEPTDEGYCGEDYLAEQDTDYSDDYFIDSNMSEKVCKLLGRVWEPGTVDEEGNEISGCSIEMCLSDDAFIVAQDDAKPYCQGYITKIDRDMCEKLHRVWVQDVEGCASRPNISGKTGAQTVKAPQCQNPYSTYVTGGADGEDRCVMPSTAGKLKGVLKNVASVAVRIAKFNQSLVCKVQPGKHWNGDRCIPNAEASHETGVGADEDIYDPYLEDDEDFIEDEEAHNTSNPKLTLYSLDVPAIVQYYTSNGTLSKTSRLFV